MIYFAILHKPSRALFPLFKAGQRRGSTYLQLPFKGMPRLFVSKAAASNCLNWWLRGKSTIKYDNDGGFSYAIGAYPGKGDSGRKKEEMEIIQVEIKQVGQTELTL